MASRCAIEGCGRRAHARGLCSTHYSRWHRHGDPLRAAPPLPARFWARVDRSGGPGVCWRWLGPPGARGQGQLTAGGRRYQMHRFAYEALVGPVPPWHALLPTCGGRGCVNPALRRLAAPEEWRRRPHPGVTHCPRGHPYSAENIYPTGRRRCRTCQRAHLAASRARRKAARAAGEAGARR
jgi:hypothetical protein